jgi:hypothetical protein
MVMALQSADNVNAHKALHDYLESMKTLIAYLEALGKAGNS